MDYVDAYLGRSVTVQLAGRPVKVAQAGLFKHYQLRMIAGKSETFVLNERLDAILEYIEVASGTSADLIEFDEIVHAFNTLLQLNEEIKLMPWQTIFRGESESIQTNANYDGRELAVIVSTIASAYGWSEEQILELPPETAACYVQEIQLDAWYREEFQYKMSAEVAYDSKSGKYKPYPKLPWLKEVIGPSIEEARGLVPARFVPDGVVIDYEKEQQAKAGR